MAEQKKNTQQDPYAEFGGSVTAPAATQPSSIPASDSGVVAGLKRFGGQLLAMPGQVYHAFADDPRNADEQAVSNSPFGQGRVALGVKRLIADPMEHEHELAVAAHARARQLGQPQFGEGSGLGRYFDFSNSPGAQADDEGNMHDWASIIPVVGPMAASMTERFVNDDKSGAATELLANIATAAIAPKVNEMAADIVRGTGRAVANPGLSVSRALHPLASPTELITRATKPSVTVPDYETSVSKALPDLYRENPNVSSVDELADTARSAAEKKNAQYQGLVGPHRGAMVDPSKVGYAQMQSIPLTHQIESPSILDATREKAAPYMQPMSVGDLDTIRVESNAKLQDILSAPGSDRAAVLRSNPEAARAEATRAATREIVYDYLKKQTGVDPAPIQNAYGDLSAVRDVAGKRSVVYGRQDPTSLAEKLGAITGPKGFVVSRILKNAVGSDALTRLAFDRYGRLVQSPIAAPTSPFLNFLQGGIALALKPQDEQQSQNDPYSEFQK